MQIIDNNDLARIQQESKVIGKGKNGIVYLYNGNVLKTFSNFSFRASDFFEHKQKKIEMLKKLDLPFYPKIFELYGSTYFNKDIFCAYEMQYIKNNLLKKFDYNKSSLEQINELLSKILKIINYSNKEGIYNLDLKLQNFILSSSKKLIGLDLDDLKFAELKNDKLEYFSTFVSLYADKYNCHQDYDKLQKYAFLGLCLSLWISPRIKLMTPTELVNMINKLNINESFKNIMLQIIYGENIELKQLLYSSINSGIKMVRK